MKKIFIIGIVILLCGLITTSCLKDEGNYDYLDLGNFYVDTVDKQVNFSIKQFSILEVNSNLIYDGNKSDLKFNWSLYDESSYIVAKSKYPLEESSGITREDLKSFSIAETENLSVEITAEPDTYILEFSAVNIDNEFAATMTYNVTVESAIGSGLLVMYKAVDAGVIDLDIVSSPVLNSGVTEVSYVRNTYTRANPLTPLTGNPRMCLAVLESVYVATDEDAKRLSDLDMTIADDFENIFLTPPSTKDFHIFSDAAVINDGKLYKRTGWGGIAFLGPTSMIGDDYYAAPFVIAAYGGNAALYDQENMRFLYSDSWAGYAVPVSANGTHFSFSNTGKKMIYTAKGYDPKGIVGSAPYIYNYGYFSIFRNPVDDGARYLYAYIVDTYSESGYTTSAAFDLSSCTEITNAEFWAFGERGPVVYYATTEKIYQMNYTLDSGVIGSSEVWTPGVDEEITCMKLFKYDGISLANSAKDKYLLVATYNSATAKGKLYLLEADIVTGVLSAEPAAVYEFSGKIADVDFIES